MPKLYISGRLDDAQLIPKGAREQPRILAQKILIGKKMENSKKRINDAVF